MPAKASKTWLSPLHIPEGSVGAFTIQQDKTPAGELFQLANLRCQLMGGQQNKVVSWDHETTWHRLQGPTGTWMTDVPCEHKQMKECCKELYGDVLVGGLGLGLAAVLLSKMKRVKRLTLVEKAPEVIQLVYQHIQTKKMQVVEADLFSWLAQCQETGKQYDTAFYDIWQSDGEGTFFKTVCPLLVASQGVVKTEPVAWNSDVMRGQLVFSLHSRLLVPSGDTWDPSQPVIGRTPALDKEIGSIFWDWAVPFFKWYLPHYGREVVSREIGYYAGLYGKWNWEEKWRRIRRPRKG